MSESSVLYDALGPRGRRNAAIASVLAAMVVVGLGALAVAQLASHGQFDGDRWEIFTRPSVQRFLLRGLWATVQAALISGVLALAVGMLLALLRLSRRRAVSWLAMLWIEFFRGVPLLLLIFFAALGLPSYGVDLPALYYLVLGLVLYNSAVIAEIVRAGILSLDRGQTEAAHAIGLTHAQTMRLVVLPQAVRRMVPALVSQVVVLLKDTSLGFVIPYLELLRRARAIGEFESQSLLQAYLVVALMYLAVNLVISRLAVRLERRQAHRYRGTAAAPARVGARLGLEGGESRRVEPDAEAEPS